jgi:hypothetical protein
MLLNEIVYRLFALMRPLLWYYHRCGRMLEIAILHLKDDDYCLWYCLWLHDTPAARAWFEGVLVDGERCLEIAIAYRVREILGLAMPIRKLGIGGFHRLHSPTSLIRLAERFDRLVARYNAIERLAQLRAARIQREIDAAPVLLVPDHRPEQVQPSLVVLVLVFFVFPRAAPAPAGRRIRAPPRPIPTARCRLPTASRRQRERPFMPKNQQNPPHGLPALILVYRPIVSGLPRDTK